MSGRSVSSGEDLSGNDEGGGVGSEVLEEVGETVKEHESSDVSLERIVSESHNGELEENKCQCMIQRTVEGECLQ